MLMVRDLLRYGAGEHVVGGLGWVRVSVRGAEEGVGLALVVCVSCIPWIVVVLCDHLALDLPIFFLAKDYRRLELEVACCLKRDLSFDTRLSLV